MTLCRRCKQPVAYVERSQAYGHSRPVPGRGHYITPTADAGINPASAVDGGPDSRVPHLRGARRSRPVRTGQVPRPDSADQSTGPSAVGAVGGPQPVFVDFAEDGYLARCRQHGGLVIRDTVGAAQAAADDHAVRHHSEATRV